MAEDTANSSFNVFNVASAVIVAPSSNLDYFFRYKITTEDGQPITQWSTINRLEQQNVSNLLDGFTPTYSISSVESGGKGVNVKWTVPDSFAATKLDIYFSWSYDGSTYTDFQYTDTVTSNSYYIDIPIMSSIKATFVKFAIQLPTNIKIINSNALLLESIPQSTAPTLDGGTIM